MDMHEMSNIIEDPRHRGGRVMNNYECLKETVAHLEKSLNVMRSVKLTEAENELRISVKANLETCRNLMTIALKEEG